MLEEFISVALEAFVNAGGDVDKFELQLRRKLMAYNAMMTTAPQLTSQVVTPQLENVLSTLNIDDPIFKELETVDVNNMKDEDILALAKKMGFMVDTEEQTDE